MKSHRFTLPDSTSSMGWVEWGERDNPKALICVHGLTRNGRDFDFLARELGGEYRILCPDMPGRGASDWLPGEQYTYPNYIAWINAWLASLNLTQVDWVGTSMGGIIGMILAASNATLIRKMVLNDIGPLVPAEGLKRLAGYVGKRVAFATRAEGEAALREIYTPFGISTDEQWQHFFAYSLIEKNGAWQLAYDPAIGGAFAEPNKIEDVDLWAFWDKIQCPVLVMRGEVSDILIRPTVSYMVAKKDVTAVEIPRVGHAPTLMQTSEIAIVKNWLLS